MTAPGGSTGNSFRRERLESALALLASPPPLQALAPRGVVVRNTSVVHPSRSRPVVRWDLDVQTGAGVELPLTVIGKGYRKGGDDASWQLLGRLREIGFDGPSLQVPRPLGWDPRRQLVAQEVAPPGTLYALLERGRFDLVGPFRRVGRWLALLHSSPDIGLPALGEHFEAAKLNVYGAELARVLPDLAPRITCLVQETCDRVLRFPAPPVLTHGDFQPKNVHLDDHRVVVIDFDRAALAPAARDLGHFIGQTRTMAAVKHGSSAVARGWVEAFSAGYLGAGGSREALAAAPAYVARTYAEVMFYRLVVRPMADQRFVPGWLDGWERCLDGAEVVS